MQLVGICDHKDEKVQKAAALHNCRGYTDADTDEAESNMKIWREGTGFEKIAVAEEDAFVRQMRYFTDCVSKGEKPALITPDETFEVIHMIDALHESAHTGNAAVLDNYAPFDFRK